MLEIVIDVCRCIFYGEAEGVPTGIAVHRRKGLGCPDRRQRRVDRKELPRWNRRRGHTAEPSCGDQLIISEHWIRRTGGEKAEVLLHPETREVEITGLNRGPLKRTVVVDLPELGPNPQGRIVDESRLIRQGEALYILAEAFSNQRMSEDL